MNELGKVNLLLVDDDDVALEVVERALRKSDLDIAIVTASDGVEALQLLQGNHPVKSIAPPYIVLLDLNMPRMNGFEFLAALRADPELTSTVVFVLTTSDRHEDRLTAYRSHIAGYMVKSEVGRDFGRALKMLDHYRDAVVLPGKA